MATNLAATKVASNAYGAPYAKNAHFRSGGSVRFLLVGKSPKLFGSQVPCELRQSAKLSQAKIAAIVGSRQSAVARFESGEAHVPADVMIRYADYFDVSLDYIFGRTDKPQGKLYEGKMKIEKVYPEMDKFIEMCFDPGSPINERLKETLREMLKEGGE